MSSEVDSPFKDPELANLMIHFLDRDVREEYVFHAYVVMPDHLHLILKPIEECPLSEIMKTIKGGAAYD